MSIQQQIIAMNVALLNSTELRAELFKQAKEAMPACGLVVFICRNSLMPVFESISVTKTFCPVPGFRFVGLPVRLLGPKRQQLREILLKLEQGKLPIIFTETDDRVDGVLTISEAMTSPLINLIGPDAKKPPVLVDWHVCCDTEYCDSEQYNNFKMCSNCQQTGDFRVCSGCRGVYYCNSNCQTANWNSHKAECPRLARFCLATSNWFG